MNTVWILRFGILLVSWFLVEGTMSKLYTNMTNGYNKLLLPVNDHRTQVNVSIQSFLVSINSFDEINGKLALTWLFTLEWIEERMSWNPDDFDNITSFALSARDIWHPRLLLQQSAGSIQELGSIENSLRIFNNGTVRWATGNVFEIVCSVDVTFFPFDKQTCHISFIDPSYGLSELAIRRPNSVSDDVEVKIHHTLQDNNKPEQNDKSNQSYSDTVSESCVAPSEITWTDVGSLFDEITAKILNAIFWTFSIITIVQLYNNTYFIDLP
ncbi:neuronal acetylcholine receptor subunit alpha-2-like [Dreissena polymorpha]|uniref:neuronal acetylcholine receptor subunit alpha-2-like n=1 Tax=Dreissena polymorpha TaxID=45954 RepID=UPI002263EC51|nr:neuronal acetylcholine receptor subunit alpha-2-like [Dreissena polymorpha]